MALPKTVNKAKVVKISVLYRDYYFVFLMLLFLSSMFAFQSVFAASAGFKTSIVHEVGYAHLQQRANFTQAQTAFENKDYAYAALLLKALAKNGHVQAQYLLATQYDIGLGVKKNEILSNGEPKVTSPLIFDAYSRNFWSTFITLFNLSRVS